MQVCYADTSSSSADIGGPYIFDNFGNSGILPGWTCEIVGCFEGDDAGDTIYYRTPRDSYTIPEGEKIYCTSLPVDYGTH